MPVLKYLLAFLVLSVVILIHEFGHYIIAKASGVVVEEFSLGMGPRLLKFTKNGTMYSLKLFLFGGSCRMKGEDIDDGETPPEGSFHAASWGKRLAILFAGPGFNFILAFVLAVILIGKAGYDPCIISHVEANSPAYEAGLEVGDQIVKINHSTTTFYGEYSLFMYDYAGGDLNITYKRDGKKYTTTVQTEHIEKDVFQMGVYLDAEEPKIAQVSKGSPAETAGLLEGDLVLSIDGEKVETTEDISPLIQAADGNESTLIVQRDGKEITIKIVPNKVHQSYYNTGYSLSGARVMASPLETVGYAFQEVGYWIKSVFMSFKLMFGGKVSVNDVAGPVGIISTIGNVVEEAAQDGGLYVFLNLLNWCIMISANLGVMNLLPIPALDGGRILFLFIELIIRKPVPKDKEGLINIVGFVLLMILMVLVLFNDIRKLIMGI